MSKIVVTSGERARELSDREVREMDVAIERSLDSAIRGEASPHLVKAADPYDLREFARDAMRGRDRRPEDWRQVMERYGYTWLEPEQLNRLIGPERYIPSTFQGIHDQYGRDIGNRRLYWTRPHTVGQWRDVKGARRRPPPGLRGMAFTIQDLVTLYGDPEAFDRYAQGRIQAHRQKRGAIRLVRR